LVLLFSAAVSAQTERQPTETIELYRKDANSSSAPVVDSIDLDRSGKFLALGGDDHGIRLWDVEQKKFVRTFPPQHQDWVRGVAFSPDRTYLATVCQSGLVRLWDAQNGTLVRSFTSAGPGARQVVFHPDGKTLAVCGADDSVRIYDIATGNVSKTLTASGTNNRTIAFSPDGTLLAVGGRTGVVRVWQTATGTMIADLKGDGRRINAIAFSPDGQKLVVGNDGPFITIWNPNDGSLLQTLPERPGKTFSLVFCDNDTLATGESDNAVRIWNLKTLTHTDTLVGHTGTIATMVYEPTKKQLITGSFDTTLRLWAITNY
jgi:WD40 repeat protein